MYDFIDRPFISLNRGGRMVVSAMRHWVRAASIGRCPCGDVASIFQERDLMVGFPHFHMMMAVLNREALDQLRFAAVDCERISEHEALILSLIRIAHQGDTERAYSIAGQVVEKTAISPLLIAMTALGQALADARLFPAMPAYGSDCMRFPDE